MYSTILRSENFFSVSFAVCCRMCACVTEWTYVGCVFVWQAHRAAAAMTVGPNKISDQREYKYAKEMNVANCVGCEQLNTCLRRLCISIARISINRRDKCCVSENRDGERMPPHRYRSSDTRHRSLAALLLSGAAVAASTFYYTKFKIIPSMRSSRMQCARQNKQTIWNCDVYKTFNTIASYGQSHRTQ